MTSQPTAPSRREIHVAVSGSDTAEGSADAPLRSIGEAARRVRPGEKVVVHAGVYREWVNPPRGGESEEKRIEFEAAPGEIVEIKGSEPITGWTKAGEGIWQAEVEEELFCGDNPFREPLDGHWFHHKDRTHHRGAVYLDGHWLAEAPNRDAVSQLSPGGERQWFAEAGDSKTKIFAHFGEIDPNEHLVEINVRRSVFYPTEPGKNYLTVRGFHLLHAATPWSPPTTEQVGLLGVNWSKGWIIEDNVVRYSICAGITLGKYHDPEDHPELPIVEATQDEDTYHGTIRRAIAQGWSFESVGNHIVRNNTVSHCEMAGICGSLGAIGSTVVGNTIHDIHVRKAFGGWEQAGIKFHAPIDSLIAHNRIFRCERGMWMDWMTQGTRLTGNLLYDNGPAEDLFVEVNHGPFLVDHNFFLSPVAIRNMSQGGAYLHNMALGKFNLSKEQKRFTPHFLPHSTQVAGWENISGEDDRFLNNILGKHEEYETGDSTSDRLSSNVFWERGESAFEVEDRGDEVFLRIRGMDTRPADAHAQSVASSDLGKTKTGNLPFRDPDGSEPDFSKDYRGKKWCAPISPGPLAGDVSEFKNRLRVWPKVSRPDDAKSAKGNSPKDH